MATHDKTFLNVTSSIFKRCVVNVGRICYGTRRNVDASLRFGVYRKLEADMKQGEVRRRQQSPFSTPPPPHISSRWCFDVNQGGHSREEMLGIGGPRIIHGLPALPVARPRRFIGPRDTSVRSDGFAIIPKAAVALRR